MEEEKSSRKPIAIDRARGLVLTRKLGEGIRVTIGDQHIDFIITQIRGKQIRVCTNTTIKEAQIHRTYLEDGTCTSSSVKET